MNPISSSIAEKIRQLYAITQELEQRFPVAAANVQKAGTAYSAKPAFFRIKFTFSVLFRRSAAEYRNAPS